MRFDQIRIRIAQKKLHLCFRFSVKRNRVSHTITASVRMLVVVLCVLCVQMGGVLMNITHAGSAEAHDVFSFLVDECRFLTGCLKSLKIPDVPFRTVSVSCSPLAMLVHVKADLFELGAPVNPQHLTLGEHCGVTEASSEEFIIHTALIDCGTRYRLMADSLVYTNVLVYDPVPSVHGVIRQERMSVPVQCVYSRFSVDAVSVVPMWLPHLSTHTAEHALHFTLRLMAADWQVMEKGVYLLGDVINMEVSVFAPLLELWVFVQDCVATTTHDAQSVPRYKFIQNGCFADGQQRSSMSLFLPRIHTNKLHLQLHTYIFRQVHSAQIFISCSLKADQQSSSSSRACSYIHGSWRSVDGDHSVCESCQKSDQFRQKPNGEGEHTQASSVQMEPGEPELGTPVSAWRNPEQADAHVFRQEVQVGPLSLSTWSEMSPPEVLEGVNITYGPSFKTKRLTAHVLQENASMPGSELWVSEEAVAWESSVSAEAEIGVVLATPTPELHFTVPPLMFTTPETINSVFETKPTAADPESTASWSTELNSTWAAGQEAAGQEAAGQEAAGQEAAGQEAAGQEAAGQEAAGQEAAGQEAAGQEAAGQEAAGQEAAGQEAAGQEAAGQEAAGQEAAGQEAAASSAHAGFDSTVM